MEGGEGNSDGFPDVGPWAKDKLARLREYLTAYSRVLNGSLKVRGWPQRILYVDAFAGSGRARLRTSRDDGTESLFAEASEEYRQDTGVGWLLDGSPFVALKITPRFTDFIFVEGRPEKVAKLRTLAAGLTEVQVIEGDCSEFLMNDLVSKPPVWWAQTCALVFLDPFGMQVRWSTIAALARTKNIEVVLNLPVGMAIQRLLKRGGDFTTDERAKLDEYFGDAGWYDLIYRREQGLFERDVSVKQENSEERLLTWYLARLKGIFGYSAGPFPVRNNNGKVIYHLLWAGHHPKGEEIAKRVFSPDRPAGTRKGTRRKARRQ